MMDLKKLINKIYEQPSFKNLISTRSKIVELRGLSGSAFSMAVAIYAQNNKGVHTVVLENKDQAGYFSNDMEELLGGENVYFFPSGYKKSIIYRQESPAGIVHRTTLLEKLNSIKKSDTLVICTYPEALAEKVASTEQMNQNSLTLKIGEKAGVTSLIETLLSLDFQRVEFVYEPNQFSVRGGIIDVFSFSDNIPYRIDFFGDDIDSIRSFDVNSQRSIEKHDSITIVAKMDSDDERMVSLLEYIKHTKAYSQINWVLSPFAMLSAIGSLGVKLSAKLAENEAEYSANCLLSEKQDIVDNIIGDRLFFKGQNIENILPQKTIEFETSLQPSFSKKFDILADIINEYTLKGYKTYIATPNKAQMDRLENAFNTVGRQNLYFENLPISLTAGFIENQSKTLFLTDHQIFERYHRYELKKQLKPSETMIASELSSLSVGDYIVHIDHGVGRYGGLLKSIENGKSVESVKIMYLGGDILLVNVHSLHKISKYKDKDSEQPKINKLGTSTWQKFKTTTKAKVKDIAKDLIALYGERKKSKGYAFSPSSYLQYELEASFIYEDTPDQQKATDDFKADMESEVPMDRLICGDVGFGKTEIAMRAAFKAVCDSKQVVVLVPTTLLSLQHYRTFNKRLKDFSISIENYSRALSAKDSKDVLQRLKAGKVDILIGTHKILGKSVEFKDLGLFIIDEEQKFGVASKEKLRKIKANVDTLTLTATPIPRTLQFSLMGVRDLSIIKTPPPNRMPVSTHVHTFDIEILKDAIDFELERGGQVFVVHNKVKTIEHIASIVKNLQPQARIVVAHGQMKPVELEKIMMDFIYGEYDVLIATTIIESGIDIPNVNTIIINDAQNFGLSSLHQLRGRVGRTNRKAYCYLFTPENRTLTETARLRLRAIEDFSELGSGFNLAMQDLDIRGAGNILGAEQSGFIANIGFEAYNKILNEAMMELNEERMELGEEEMTSNSEPLHYISDCQIDTDSEAIIPDTYISNVNEKIKLYRQIDKIETLEEVEAVSVTLKDRFGDLPLSTENLLRVVLIRKKCIDLGFEKAIIKNGVFIVHFIYNQESPYYKSITYQYILKFISLSTYIFKTRNDKLLLSMPKVKGVKEALEILCSIEEFIEEQKKYETNN
ncbi:MAG: transcription-repair coupling factor [Bacteroidetes bacterium]|nr:transcription-repair coupling factor [Bacteroidota bacterium]